MTRAVLLLGLSALLLSLAGCNCGPVSQSTSCTWGVDPPRCYTCPSTSAAATCETSGPSAAGCNTTAVACP